MHPSNLKNHFSTKIQSRLTGTVSLFLVVVLICFVSFGQSGQVDLSFNPGDVGNASGSNANGTIYATCVQPDGKILIGGNFTQFDGTSINRIARLLPNGVLDPTFVTNGGANNIVYTIELQADGKILIGGSFFSVGGVTNYGLARLNSDGSVDNTFASGNVYGAVKSIEIMSNNKIIIAGGFSSIEGYPTNNIGRLNANGTYDNTFNSGTEANYDVLDVKLLPNDKMIIVGAFTSYNGTARNRIAKLNADGSLDASFVPGTGSDATLNAISLRNDGTMIVGGELTSYNGQVKVGLVKISANGSIDNSFNYAYTNQAVVNAIDTTISGDLIIGGNFLNSGIIVNRVLKLNSSGVVDGIFQPQFIGNAEIYAVKTLQNNKILVAGTFSVDQGIVSSKIEQLELDGSIYYAFNGGTAANEEVHSVSVQADGKVLIGGYFTTYDGTQQNHFSRLNNNGTLDNTFTMGSAFNGTVFVSKQLNDGTILCGGSFSLYDGTSVPTLVKLTNDGNLDPTFTTGTISGGIRDLLVQPDNKIIIVGGFSSINGQSRNRIARINPDGSLDPTFTVGTAADNQVFKVALQPDGKIIICGNFNTFNGILSPKMVRLNANGTLDNTFTAEFLTSNVVNSIVVQTDGKIMVCGNFPSYGQQSGNDIVRLNADGTLDLGFVSGSGFGNGSPEDLMVLPNGKIIVSGNFNSYNGTVCKGITRLNQNGTIDTNFDTFFGASYLGGNAFVYDFARQVNGNLIIVGSFTSFNAIGRNRVARIYNCPEDTTILTVSACNDYTLNSQTYTVSGTYYQSLTGFQGCDSIVKIVLSINSNANTISVTSCDSYTLNGQTYTASGAYSQTLTNVAGCDSLLTLNLIINNANAETVNATVCDTYTLNGQTYTSSGSYTQTLTNVAGCDSLLTLNLTIINSSTSTLSTTACDSYTLNGQTYISSGTYTQTLTNAAGCDSVLTLNLTINYPNSETISTTACDTYTINGQTYTTSGTYNQTLTNVAGCDSILTLILTIIPLIPQQTNTFSLPSNPNNCLGLLAIQTTGNPDFTADIDGGTQFTYSGYHLEQNLCPGVHSLSVTDACGNTLPSTFVIPVDTNYVFNNPFIDSIAVDSLGQTIENCDIYYNSIDTAFIDSLWANGNTVNVIWNIVDSNGSNLDTNTYELNNGNGVYWLQLNVFCPVRALGDYFTVTEAIYFEDGNPTMAGLDDPELFEVSLFPNPSDGIVTVTAEVSGAALSVMDTQGKTIVSNQSLSSQTKIDLSFVQSGVYFFRVETEIGSVVKRVVKH